MTTMHPDHPTRPRPDLDHSKRVDSVDEAIERLKASYWRRYDNNPDVRQKLEGKDRTILLDITDDQPWTFNVRNGVLASVEPGRNGDASVVVSVTKSDLFALYNGELKPVDAFMKKRVKVKAGFRDMLFAKSLLGW